jgi:hypothetical protein
MVVDYEYGLLQTWSPNIKAIELVQKGNTIYRAMCNETTILNQANTKRSMIVYNFNWLTDHRNLEEKDTRLFNTGVSFKLLSMCT